MKKLVLPLAILFMAGFIFAAACWDCVRLAGDARHRVQLADEEMQKHEQRLVKLLSSAPSTTPEIQSAIDSYKKATEMPARHDAYEKLIAAVRKTSDKVDPTNPLDRKFMDDVAGAINRREVAQKPYDEEAAAYKELLNSFRGSLAQIFSSQARADHESASSQ